MRQHSSSFHYTYVMNALGSTLGCTSTALCSCDPGGSCMASSISVKRSFQRLRGPLHRLVWIGLRTGIFPK
ncbi:hypothetical protein BDV33DRAFT_166616 [Aspergillus novoparasiticus]|uniref:Uncharacterized protein n=1 Tax=Aspergillus novoparasiticus TaxID=986946 RepID=A0A5N6F2K1_9EURO|nr:hypothetical protein BDV33DRAFT_166616 [Aspergillus novoparasiticus]